MRREKSLTNVGLEVEGRVLGRQILGQIGVPLGVVAKPTAHDRIHIDSEKKIFDVVRLVNQ